MEWQEWRTRFNSINFNYYNKTNNFHLFYPDRLTFPNGLPTSSPPQPVAAVIQRLLWDSPPRRQSNPPVFTRISVVSCCLTFEGKRIEFLEPAQCSLTPPKNEARLPGTHPGGAFTTHRLPLSRGGQRNVTTSTTEAEIVIVCSDVCAGRTAPVLRSAAPAPWCLAQEPPGSGGDKCRC